jgi:hypothetical protein
VASTDQVWPHFKNVENIRRTALMVPDENDVAMGSFVGVGGAAALIRAQTATIAEQVI